MGITKDQLIQRSKEIFGGTRVFAGTRVPVQTIVDYMKRGHSLDKFLDDFPTVTCKQALAALDIAKAALVSQP